MLVEALRNYGADALIDGVVVQLPLPAYIHVATILAAIPTEKDIDVLSPNAIAKYKNSALKILPPVAAAVQCILEQHAVSVVEKDVVILGNGRLVGAPVALLFRHNHAHVTVFDKPVQELAHVLRDADIVVSGVGKPGLVQPHMLKKGVVLIDAGTSESQGMLVGDVDPACAEHAALMTPVPGGVGPLTVVMLLKNACIMQGIHALGTE